MSVPMGLCVLFFYFSAYISIEAAYTCSRDQTCIPITECQQFESNEGEVLYPCHHGKYVCCPTSNRQASTYITTDKSILFTSAPVPQRNKYHEIVPLSIDAPSNGYNNVNKGTGDTKTQNHNTGYDANEGKVGNSVNSNKNQQNHQEFHNYNNHQNNSNPINNKRNEPSKPINEDNYDNVRLNIPNHGSDNSKLKDKNSNAKGNFGGKVKELFKKNCGISIAVDKITGGQVAEPGQFPWMALLGFKQTGSPNTQFLCGGSLITNQHILTAAHCIVENRPLELVLVRLGEYNLTTTRDCVKFGNDELCLDQHVDMPVDRVVVHPSYNRHNLKNDIAIIKVRHNVRESEYIRTICLPFDRNISELDLTGQNFTVSGWGKSKSGDLFGSDILQYAKVTTWNQQRCNNSIPSEVKPLSSSQLCANGANTEDACKGDSGGPLINITLDKNSEIRHIQFGVVSFGTATCGDRNLPTIYTRVDKYLQWIVENVT